MILCRKSVTNWWATSWTYVVFCCIAYIIVLTITTFQFKPVAVSPDDPVGACKIPARITVSGTVFSVDKERHSFVVFPTLSISASPNPQTLPVRAVLEKSPRWPNPVARLPSSPNFVAFTGKLAYFEDFAGKSQDFQTQAVVIVDSITYLRSPSNPKNVSLAPSTSRSPNNDADTVALKTRVLKYSQGTSSKMEDDRLSGSSKTATSQEEEKYESEVWIGTLQWELMSGTM